MSDGELDELLQQLSEDDETNQSSPNAASVSNEPETKPREKRKRPAEEEDERPRKRSKSNEPEEDKATKTSKPDPSENVEEGKDNIVENQKESAVPSGDVLEENQSNPRRIEDEDDEKQREEEPEKVESVNEDSKQGDENEDSKQENEEQMDNGKENEEPKPKEKAPPRLFIEKIEIENFKSYKGIRTLGPFHQNFSSIVGPNGSGKSNVLDALLFVFVKSGKQLRIAKQDALINHSKIKDASGRMVWECEFARVTVFFYDIQDNDDGGYDVIEGSQFQITRTVHRKRSPKTQFRIGTKRAKQSEVRELLLSKGIDLKHNRFMILQGDVEKISMMPPIGEKNGETGLLEYLEEVVGTKEYIPLLEEMKVRDEELEEEKATLLSRVKAVEQQRKDLEKGKETAKEFLVKMISRNLYKYRIACGDFWHYSKERVAGMKKLDEMDAQVTELENKMKSLAEEKKTLEDAKVEYQTAFKNANKEFKKAQTAFEKKQKTISTLKEEQKDLKKGGKKKAKDLEKILKEVEENQDKVKVAEEAIPGLEEEMKKMEKQLETDKAELEQKKTELAEKTTPFREKLEVFQKEKIPLEDEVNKAQAAVDELGHKIANEKNHLRSKQEKLKDRIKKYEKAQQEKKDAKNAGMEAVAKKQEKDEEVEMLQKNAKTAREEVVAKKEELNRLAEVQRKLVHKRAQMNQGGSNSRALQALLDAQKKGKLSGIHGSLGNLGSVPDFLDVAASTAGGSLLRKIVVDTGRQGEECIKFARKHKLGSISMIVLQKMTQWHNKYNVRFDCPDSETYRILDKVTCDDKFRGAFAYTFKNTIVAKDMDHAKNVAYDRRGKPIFRVVTLNGEVINTSGAMQGGGRRQIRGLITLSRRGESIKPKGAQDQEEGPTEEQVDAAVRAWKQCDHAVMKMDRDIRNMDRQVDDCKRARDNLTNKCKECDVRYTVKKKLVTELKQSLAALKEEIAKEEPEVEKNIKRHKNAQSKALEVLQKREKKRNDKQAEIDRVNAQIDEAGGAEVKDLEKKIKRNEKKYDKKEEKKLQYETDLKTCQKKLKKLEKKQNLIQKAFGDLQKKIDKIKQKVDTYKEEIEPLAKNMVELEKKKDEAEKQFQEANKKWDEFRSTLRELEQQLKKAKHAAKLILTRVKHVNEKINSLKEHQQKFISEIDGAERMMYSDDRHEYDPEEDDYVMFKSENEEDKEKMKGFYDERESMKSKIEKLNKDIRNSDQNMQAFHAWRKKNEEYIHASKVHGAKEKEKDAHHEKYVNLKNKRTEEFVAGFEIIQAQLKKMFRCLTDGGDADLEYVDSMDPFSEGIKFTVRPKRKSWNVIQNLSGGEKTLSSLSLVFALHHYSPAPLYVMDEIDAALDFKNVSIVSNYIKKETRNAQFVIISLRNQMFDLADRLIGIYKLADVTRTMPINPHKYVLDKRLAFAKKGRNKKRRGSQSQKDGKKRKDGSAEKSQEVEIRKRKSSSISEVALRKKSKPAKETPILSLEEPIVDENEEPIDPLAEYFDEGSD